MTLQLFSTISSGIAVIGKYHLFLCRHCVSVMYMYVDVLSARPVHCMYTVQVYTLYIIVNTHVRV